MPTPSELEVLNQMHEGASKPEPAEETITRSALAMMCDNLRAALRTDGSRVLDLRARMSAKEIKTGKKADGGEIIANITLAYRHVEDAVMRLGKAIQADEGGVSRYDK